MINKEKFLKYQAQTTENPICLDISDALGSFIYTKDKKKYLDFVAGVSAANLGHKNIKILKYTTTMIIKNFKIIYLPVLLVFFAL